jgi:hypothetical protein
MFDYLSIDCPTCGSKRGRKCTNWQGRGCAPHSLRKKPPPPPPSIDVPLPKPTRCKRCKDRGYVVRWLELGLVGRTETREPCPSCDKKNFPLFHSGRR